MASRSFPARSSIKANRSRCSSNWDSTRFGSSELPTQELLEEADRLGLWLICPPPRPTQSRRQRRSRRNDEPDRAGVRSRAALGLGRRFDHRATSSTRRLAEQLRTADRRVGAALICKPQSDLRGYSQLGNNDMTLLVDRRPLGTSMELKDYGTWVSRQPLGGAARHADVDHRANAAQRSAADANRRPRSEHPPPSCVSFEQMRLLDAHGGGLRQPRIAVPFFHAARMPPIPATRQRAMSLNLLNLELALVEPWAAAGSYLDYGRRQLRAASHRHGPPRRTRPAALADLVGAGLAVRAGPIGGQ